MQPANGIARSRDEALTVAERIGYPVLLRPSYVLGGRGMEVVDGPEQLDHYIATAVAVSGASPVLIDRYLRDAVEVDVDAISRRHRRRRHRRHAAYRGSRACIRATAPARSRRTACPAHVVDEIERQTGALARALKVTGLMNVQFAVKGEEVYLIEVNPRASRTVPFVAKAIGRPIAKMAALVMVGEKLSQFEPIGRELGHIAVKQPVFPFLRFPGCDPVLGPEMRSTGEVMGIDQRFRHRVQQGAARRRHPSAAVGDLVRVGQGQRQAAYRPGGRGDGRAGLQDHRHRRHRRLSEPRPGCRWRRSTRSPHGRPHIVDRITDGDVQLVFNTTEGWQSLKDSHSIRATALQRKVPYFTTAAASLAVARSLGSLEGRALEVRSLQSYYSASVN